MCCIFTCFGWLIDMIQRVWVFAMSFCMSGAVCCVMMLGSLSGVALGYNYSLAEFMDLKETNVSVYLKRGIFDDDSLTDDMNFRRSGEEGPENLANSRRRSGGRDDDGLRSGRRLDDSLLQSNQNHGFEGGLMKLTMAAPLPATTTTRMPWSDINVDDLSFKHAPGSLNQLKDVQSRLSYKKALAAREPNQPRDLLLAGYPAGLLNEQQYVPPHVLKADPSPGRRAWQDPSTEPHHLVFEDRIPGKMNPALMAVPVPQINLRKYWEGFKQSSHIFATEYIPAATSPKPIRLNTLDQTMFPTTPPSPPVFTEETDAPSSQQAPSHHYMTFGMEGGGDQLEQKLILDKYAQSRTTPYPMMGEDQPKSENEYYDDDIKGLPVRRKRHIHTKSKDENKPRSEQAKSEDKHTDQTYKVNLINDVSNTDPSILVSKLDSKYKVPKAHNAGDLISKQEKSPLEYDQLINKKVYKTGSRVSRGLFEKTGLSLKK